MLRGVCQAGFCGGLMHFPRLVDVPARCLSRCKLLSMGRSVGSSEDITPRASLFRRLRKESAEGVFSRFLRISVTLLSLPIILLGYFQAETGREFGVGFFKKIWLVLKMARNRRRILTASHFLEHLIMATQILRVPRSVEGSVVECGSFKGGSAANLSLVCDLCDRKLEVFDSFGGLPEPSDTDKRHILVNSREIHSYEQGAFCGTLPEVQRNISKYGKISACNFHVGYFEKTLPDFSQKCVLAFLDVDLTDSLETCLTYLWPLLQDGCCLFTHEAHHMEIAGFFFQEEWWRSKMHCAAPGLIGAGTGLGLIPSPGGFRSCLGYAVKNPNTRDFELNPQLGQSGVPALAGPGR
jgi:O-methyltransferase